MRIVRKESGWTRKFAWLPVNLLDEKGQQIKLLFESYEEKSECCGHFQNITRRLPNSPHEYKTRVVIGRPIMPPPDLLLKK